MKLRLLFSIFLMLSYSWPLGSASAATPIDTMVANINEAKQRLERTENKISKVRGALANEVRMLEQQVLRLRNETAVMRRKMDERTLSLSQLETRLSSWQEQHEYQLNLLDRFLLQSGEERVSLQQLTILEKVQKVGEQAQYHANQQVPHFTQGQVVLENGTIENAQTLSLGPITWYLSQDSNIAGIAAIKNGLLSSISTFDLHEIDNLRTLANDRHGLIKLDPTLGRATTRQQASDGMVEHVIKGGVWVIPIVIFGVVSALIALFKVVQLWRLPRVKRVVSGKAMESINGSTESGSLGSCSDNSFEGMQHALYHIAKHAETSAQRDDELFSQLQQDKIKLEKYNGTIAVTAAVAPLLGLLGTVSGMIETFRMMTAFGASDPEVISGGIAKALVTTELGLVVAIPALILNAVLSRKSRQYYDELESFALVLSNDQCELTHRDVQHQEGAIKCSSS
ncbi:MAG: biopolymer transporter [Alteromonas sp. Nap_26]|nr:MAG: biopolymer transporter [Alteromonas sp. Nap_26]